MILKIHEIIQLHHLQRHLGKIELAIGGIDHLKKIVGILLHFERIQLAQGFFTDPFFIDHAAEQAQQRDPDYRISHGIGSERGQNALR